MLLKLITPSASLPPKMRSTRTQPNPTWPLGTPSDPPGTVYFKALDEQHMIGLRPVDLKFFAAFPERSTQLIRMTDVWIRWEGCHGLVPKAGRPASKEAFLRFVRADGPADGDFHVCQGADKPFYESYQRFLDFFLLKTHCACPVPEGQRYPWVLHGFSCRLNGFTHAGGIEMRREPPSPSADAPIVVRAVLEDAESDASDSSSDEEQAEECDDSSDGEDDESASSSEEDDAESDGDLEHDVDRDTWRSTIIDPAPSLLRPARDGSVCRTSVADARKGRRFSPVLHPQSPRR